MRSDSAVCEVDLAVTGQEATADPDGNRVDLWQPQRSDAAAPWVP
jgi:hypothetical protein